VLHVGVYSPLLLALYLLALKGVHAHERQAMAAARSTPLRLCATAPRRSSCARMAPLWRWPRWWCWLPAAGCPKAADTLARSLGISRSFAGTVLMSLVTTLPEMAVTLGALRLGALDMAIGNLLGSNLFNVVILAVDDAFYVRGPLLADAPPCIAGTAVTAMLMTGLVTIGLVMRPQGRALRVLSWVSVGLVAAYGMQCRAGLRGRNASSRAPTCCGPWPPIRHWISGVSRPTPESPALSLTDTAPCTVPLSNSPCCC
jgi:cation:H+ antiporter